MIKTSQTIEQEFLEAMKPSYRYECTWNGIKVFFDPCLQIPAQSKGLWPFKKIVVGKQYLPITPREKMAILSHEEAHCKKFHLERRILALWAIIFFPKLAAKWACQHELDADAFAAKHGYGVELREALSGFKSPPSMFYPPFKVRAAALTALIEGKKA